MYVASLFKPHSLLSNIQYLKILKMFRKVTNLWNYGVLDFWIYEIVELWHNNKKDQ